MDRLLVAVQQLHVVLAENPRPPGTPHNSAVSPLARGRRQAPKAATTAGVNGVPAGGSATSASINDVLVPSNSDGRDDHGYFVPSKHPASEMLRDFCRIPLGTFSLGGSIEWATAAKWAVQRRTAGNEA